MGGEVDSGFDQRAARLSKLTTTSFFANFKHVVKIDFAREREEKENRKYFHRRSLIFGNWRRVSIRRKISRKEKHEK